MVCAILYREASENMGCVRFEAKVFPHFSVYSADLDIPLVVFPPRQISLSFTFMHKISTRMVCVNGKQPWFPPPSIPQQNFTFHILLVFKCQTQMHGLSLHNNAYASLCFATKLA